MISKPQFYLTAFLSFAFPIAAHAQSFSSDYQACRSSADGAGDMFAVRNCLYAETDKQDLLLNASYQCLRERTEDGEALRDQQRAWISETEQNCATPLGNHLDAQLSRALCRLEAVEGKTTELASRATVSGCTIPEINDVRPDLGLWQVQDGWTSVSNLQGQVFSVACSRGEGTLQQAGKTNEFETASFINALVYSGGGDLQNTLGLQSGANNAGHLMEVPAFTQSSLASGSTVTFQAQNHHGVEIEGLSATFALRGSSRALNECVGQVAVPSNPFRFVADNTEAISNDETAPDGVMESDDTRAAFLIDANEISNAWSGVTQEERRVIDLLEWDRVAEAKELTELLGLDLRSRQPYSFSQLYFSPTGYRRYSPEVLSFFFDYLDDDPNFAFPKKTVFFEWVSGPAYTSFCDLILAPREYQGYRSLDFVADELVSRFDRALSYLDPSNLDPKILGEIGYRCVVSAANKVPLRGEASIILPRILDILAGHGADFDWVGSSRDPVTALWAAISANDPSAVRQLIELGASAKQLHIQRKDGRITNVHSALSVWQWPTTGGQEDDPRSLAAMAILNLLLDEGVSVAQPYGSRARNFIERARTSGNLTVLRALRDRGLL
ncbi:lysozyme inhibitor LprI family protein [Pseudophaeobacter profundi]|uniref:lysozyme inhibitor LprI family protein n=1 Tax=Pseudophaeobacter profundi TaxID=3034152 RepID=UPI00242AD999|nr:lysozyme inhibitor LprI family protein [Pseudophaeobacter profundi]